MPKKPSRLRETATGSLDEPKSVLHKRGTRFALREEKC